ncbi:MAG: DUF6125 family protein [Promethearchaeota archaeon]
MKELTVKDKLFFFEKHFFTLDGLWMIEAEKKMDWDVALELDLKVWLKLLKIIIKRLKKYLNIQGNDIIDLVEILTFRWSIEGWKYDIMKMDSDEVYISVKGCPYKSAMDRNPDRYDKIPLICNNMCKPFYHEIVKEFNPSISLKRTKFMGLKDDAECDFRLSMSQSQKIDKEKLKERVLQQKIRDKDKLFYFERNFRTLDGLWVIETENEIDFKTALELDIVVWQRLYSIIFRRVMKYLKIEGNTLEDLISILSFVWNCEGNLHEIIRYNKEEIQMNITVCPYIDAMKRNPDRHNRIVSICKDMCVPYLDPVIKEFNKNIKIRRSQFIGLGDNKCDFHLTLKE